MAFRTNKTPVLQTKSASGSVATFNTALAMPLSSCNIALTATQSGSGTPSPDNVRTINGYSNINIMATGKNFAPINAHSQTASGTTITVDADGVATVSGTAEGSHFFEYYRGNFNFPKGTYRITAWVNGEEYTQSGTYSPYRIYISMTNGGQVNAGNSFTVNQDTGLWLIYIQTRNGFTYDNDEVKIQIELGTEATEWQKFGKLVTISIGSTVYGGEYDARTGVLTVTHEIIDLGSINYTYRTDTTKPIFQASYVIHAKPRTSSVIGNDICSIYKTVSSDNVSQDGYDYSIAINAPGRNIYIQDSRYTVASDFKTAMNGVQLVYELATPTTIQLPPCPIDTLQGVNNIWADTGDIDLTYKDLDIAKRGNFREVFKLPS